MRKVYFLRCTGTGLVKVGIASNTSDRVAMLQTGNPNKLILLLEVKATKQIESSLHTLYRDKHVRGEWFDLDIRDIFAGLSYIESKVVYGDIHKLYTDLSIWMKKNGVSPSEIRERIKEITGKDVTLSAVCRWRAGNRRPQDEFARAIEVITNNSVRYS